MISCDFSLPHAQGKVQRGESGFRRCLLTSGLSPKYYIDGDEEASGVFLCHNNLLIRWHHRPAPCVFCPWQAAGRAFVNGTADRLNCQANFWDRSNY
jgi:hypothetical protein